MVREVRVMVRRMRGRERREAADSMGGGEEGREGGWPTMQQYRKCFLTYVAALVWAVVK